MVLVDAQFISTVLVLVTKNTGARRWMDAFSLIARLTLPAPQCAEHRGDPYNRKLCPSEGLVIEREEASDRCS